jgi:hypothetical protein
MKIVLYWKYDDEKFFLKIYAKYKIFKIHNQFIFSLEKIFLEKSSAFFFWIILGDLKKNQIFHFKKINIKKILNFKFKFLEKKEMNKLKIFIINEKFSFLDRETSIDFLSK